MSRSCSALVSRTVRLAGADAMRTGFAAVKFGWTAFVIPFLFIAAPSLLMTGSAIDVAWAAVTAVAGVWFACFGVIGYLTRPLKPWMRICCVAVGLMMLVPAGAFEGGFMIDILGIGLALAVFVYETKMKRRLGRA